MRKIYLDYAAATPLDERVLAAMRPYFTERFYNPSAVYGAGREVHGDIEAARRTVAQTFGARPAEIVFTAGGSEANNLAIKGVMDELRELFPEAQLLMSAIEHESVLAAGQRYGYQLLPVTAQGSVEPAAVARLISDQTVLISVMYANNEIGTIQPLGQIGRLVQTVRRDRQRRGVGLPLYLHSDAAQAANYLDLQTARLGVDLMSINGGKLYGPKQSGALYVRAGVRLRPLIEGGGQERNLRSGTENAAGVIGLASALDIAQQMRHEESRRLRDLQDYFCDQLARRIPTARLNGSRKRRLPNNLHITLPGSDNERLLFGLDEAGIMASAGSACSASSQAASHVLAAIGMSEADARASLRLSMGRQTTRDELDRTLEVLGSLL